MRAKVVATSVGVLMNIALVKKLVISLAMVPVLLNGYSAAQTPKNRPYLERTIRRVVNEALVEAPPDGYARIPVNVRLLSVQKKKGVLILNFSKELVSNSRAELEDAIHQILTRINNLESGSLKISTYRILIEGRPLEGFLRECKKEE